MNSSLRYSKHSNNVILFHSLHDADSSERPHRIRFRVLQQAMDWLSTGVRRLHIMVLDRVGQTAPADSRKLPGSFRSTVPRWNLALCSIFQFLGRRFFYQLQVDHRRMVWRYRIRCDGVSQRSTFSTYDADHDTWLNVNCASDYGGGFWYLDCGDAYVTTSTTSEAFVWLTPTGWMYLKAVEVSLLCQWAASDDDDRIAG